MILAAWLGQPGLPPLAPLLFGDPGVGKNRVIYELARCTRKPLYILQGHSDVTPEDLVCSVRFSDGPDKKMDYVLSPLATAMQCGGICFIDEIGKLRPKALAPLASVLDERRYLDSTLLGERIHAHAGFRFVAATNRVDIDAEGLPDFIDSRLRPMIEVGHPSRSDIEQIVKTRFDRIDRGDGSLLEHFWDLWNEHKEGAAPSARDTIYLFGLTLSLADEEAASAAYQLQSGERVFGQPTASHLQAAFEQMFLYRSDYDDRQSIAA